MVVLTNGLFLQRSEGRFARWPMERLHLQISVDGLEAHHDRTRGDGTFGKLERELRWLGERSIPFTVSMCVMHQNVDDMPDIVDFAASVGAANVHFLWYFVRGRGEEDEFVPPERIFSRLVEATRRADAHGIGIDNIEAIAPRSSPRREPFTTAATAAGSRSRSATTDGLYPSPALVGVERAATPLNGGLAETWRRSPVLEELRRSSATESTSPLRFIFGGGDHDHSLVHGGRFQGHDPYLPLYEKIALWLIAGGRRAAAGRRPAGAAAEDGRGSRALRRAGRGGPDPLQLPAGAGHTRPRRRDQGVLHPRRRGPSGGDRQPGRLPGRARRPHPRPPPGCAATAAAAR